MIEIAIKPLSVNQAWKGKRFKTKAYKAYEKQLLLMLPKVTISTENLSVFIEFGFSNNASDIDNPVKPLIDIMQKKYGFNDKQIMEMTIKKTITKKGDEFIKFEVKSHDAYQRLEEF